MQISKIGDAFEAIAEACPDVLEFPIAVAAAIGAAKASQTHLRQIQETLQAEETLFLPGKFAYGSGSDFEEVMIRLRADPRLRKNKTRILLAYDGQMVRAQDLRDGDTLVSPIQEIGDHYGFFLPLAGHERLLLHAENPLDVKATRILARLHRHLIVVDPSWGTEARRHAMNLFMTRLIFVLFAEDTGILPEDLFKQTVRTYAGQGGQGVQGMLLAAFRAMNLSAQDPARSGLPAWTSEYPYVNGGLFAGPIDAPVFDAVALGYLRDLVALRWQEINPDIFGSMIQVVADPAQRSSLGMHYTSVPNILKVLKPLFLDDLETRIGRAWNAPKDLQRIRSEMGRIRVFDPACGSGNFLVVAYREMRRLEARILELVANHKGVVQTSFHSEVRLENFYGIELEDFAAETAKLAFHIAHYQADRRHQEAFGRLPSALPLTAGAKIATANALRADWSEICPPAPDRTTYVVGNPPFLGSTYQDEAQKADMDAVFGQSVRSHRKLDYVAGFFRKTAEFLRQTPGAAALVSTNSICQGESVGILWESLLGTDLEIGFAYRSFPWRNNASDNAAVTCVIVSLRPIQATPKTLFDGEETRRAVNISPYLIDSPTIIVKATGKSIFGLPEMLRGNQPTDGGNLLLSPMERNALLQQHPEAAPLIRPIVGSEELIHRKTRYCLWITDASLTLAQSIPFIAKRIEKVRQIRLASPDPGARKMAIYPHQFREMNEAKDKTIIVAAVSSEKRKFLPTDILESKIISSNRNFIIRDAEDYIFSVISSKMHWCWIDAVCGKLETRFNYSNTIGWNTFPVPNLTAAQKETLAENARRILLARDAHPGASIADLYEPSKMPDNLREAHAENDRHLESLYRRKPFASDAERLEHLFERYARRISEMKEP